MTDRPTSWKYREVTLPLILERRESELFSWMGMVKLDQQRVDERCRVTSVSVLTSQVRSLLAYLLKESHKIVYPILE